MFQKVPVCRITILDGDLAMSLNPSEHPGPRYASRNTIGSGVVGHRIYEENSVEQIVRGVVGRLHMLDQCFGMAVLCMVKSRSTTASESGHIETTHPKTRYCLKDELRQNG